MCCPTDCRPNLKPAEWMPCIECMDEDELYKYRLATGDYRKSGFTPPGLKMSTCKSISWIRKTCVKLKSLM